MPVTRSGGCGRVRRRARAGHSAAPSRARSWPRPCQRGPARSRGAGPPPRSRSGRGLAARGSGPDECDIARAVSRAGRVASFGPEENVEIFRRGVEAWNSDSSRPAARLASARPSQRVPTSLAADPPRSAHRLVSPASQGSRDTERDAAHLAPHCRDAGPDRRCPVHIVAARLGDDPKTVLDTYAHLLPQSDEIAAERVAIAIADTAS